MIELRGETRIDDMMDGGSANQAGDTAERKPPLRVLVVDDNSAIVRFLVAGCSAAGCETASASTAEEALDLIEGAVFDLVIADIKMPGLSGLDLLRAVKGRLPATPVVLITGAPSVDSAVFALRHGAYDYLLKPFTFQDVQRLIEQVRADLRQSNGKMILPAGLNEELARRQFGVEALFRLGESALQGLTRHQLAEMVLEVAVRSLIGDAAILLLRDERGGFGTTQNGEVNLRQRLASLLHAHLEELLRSGTKGSVSLTGKGDTVAAIAALVPGTGEPLGIICLGRNAQRGAFLPDERAFLLGYAQTTAVVLQKILLRENLERNLVNTVSAFVSAIESKDPYLKGHSARVSMYSGELAGALHLPEADVLMIARAGLLHDLGKLVALDSILRKPGPLTKEERALIQTHPVVGEKILRPIPFLAEESKAVRHHHERYDGRGYPDKIEGEAIPHVARIVTVADAFDAMTSDRPYRRRLEIDVARQEIERGVGSQFDPVLAEAFLAVPVERLEAIGRSWSMRHPSSSAAVDPIDSVAAAAALMGGRQ